MSVSAGEALPLDGVRVIDMTTFWAGPSCTHLLAMLGADVIHVESTRHPDGTRLIAGIPVTEDLWWERSPIFSGLNTDKRGLTLNLQSSAGRDVLNRLIATADVVVENFTPRVLESMGLTYDAVQGDQAGRDHGADAGLRARWTVARQPGVRLCHRGRRRDQLAHRLSRPQPVRALFGG